MDGAYLSLRMKTTILWTETTIHEWNPANVGWKLINRWIEPSYSWMETTIHGWNSSNNGWKLINPWMGTASPSMEPGNP